jgi:hypothetical protein
LPPSALTNPHKIPLFAQANGEKGEFFLKKQEEKQPIPWEVTDPKPPVIRAAHSESHVRHRNTEA